MEFELIEKLLHQKSFKELNKEEKDVAIASLGNEENYEEMRAAILGISQERIPLKRSIDQEILREFKKQESPLLKFFSYKVPAFIPMVLLLFLMGFYTLRTPQVISQIEEVPVEVMVYDTINVVEVQVDTVWRERIVKVQAPVLVSQVGEATVEEEVLEVTNKSLSNQTDLLDLVVRGE